GRARLHLRRYPAHQGGAELVGTGADRARGRDHAGGDRVLARRPGLDSRAHRGRHRRLVQLPWQPGVEWSIAQQARTQTMNEKIKSIDELSTIAAQARADGRKVVLAH